MKLIDCDFRVLSTLIGDERFRRTFDGLTESERAELTCRDYPGVPERVLRIHNGDTAIIEVVIGLGGVESVTDLRERAAAPKVVGLGQGINRYPGMWEGQPS